MRGRTRVFPLNGSGQLPQLMGAMMYFQSEGPPQEFPSTENSSIEKKGKHIVAVGDDVVFHVKPLPTAKSWASG